VRVDTAFRVSGDRRSRIAPNLKSCAIKRLAQFHAGLNYAFPPKNTFL
jgi:hypothetical protein